MFNKDIKLELRIIDELKVLFEVSSGRIGIGDDAAVIEHNQLLSSDAMVEGVHFLKDKSSWKEIAYKLFVSNASDMAAMGGFATGYLLTLSIPKYWTNQDFRQFVSGIKLFFQYFPADLLGGDTIHSNEFFASVTVIGKSYNRPWLRSGAKVGDFIYCTGNLGDSKLWLNKELNQNLLPFDDQKYFRMRHYYPTPRVSWISALNKYKITSAIDISDGLVEDLYKLCNESAVNFYIDSELLPLSINEIGKHNYNEHKVFYQKEALIGGEDYELIFTSPEVLDEAKLLSEGVKATRIGRILPAQESSLILWNRGRYGVKDFEGYRH